MKRTMVIIACCSILLAGGALLVTRHAAAQSNQREPEEYRVELVQNDQYKVQKGLNAMARQGWTFVSSIPRNDGKVLLVFHKYE
jgi:hypothetical protein